MNKQEILKVIGGCQIFHLATIEGNKPHVRGMMLYRADENGIIFHTGKAKDLDKQLRANPAVEMCFNNLKNNVQIRVSGIVEQMEDAEFKEEIVANRPFLKPWIDQDGYGSLTVYRLKNGTATIWTFENNFTPKTYIEL